MSDYFIWAKRHQRPEAKCLLWWLPDRCGYTYRIVRAGLYDEAAVRDICSRGLPGEKFAISQRVVLALPMASVPGIDWDYTSGLELTGVSSAIDFAELEALALSVENELETIL